MEENKFSVKELKYKDLIAVGDIPKEDMAKKLMILSTGMSEEEYNNLGMKEGMELQKEINEVNGLVDFQEPLTE